MSMPIRSLVFTLLVAAACLVQAAPFDPAARAKAIAPFIDEQTILVAHVDLTRTEIDPIYDKLLELVPLVEQAIGTHRAKLQRGRAGFLEAGVREYYVVVSLADLPRHAPVVIIPRAGGVDLAKLRASVPPPGPNDVIEPVGDAVFLGLRAALDRVKAMKPDTRAELAKAFDAAGDTAVQLLVLPPSHAARVIRETMPTLPAEVGGGPSTILTDGLLWAALGVDVTPKLSLRLTIQSQDREAAAALRAKWLDAVRLLSAQEDVRKAVPDFREVAASTIPTVEGDRLVLALSEAEGTIQGLSAAIAPPIEKARARARRRQSMTNLKRLGLGMHNYHEVHNYPNNKKKTLPAVGNTDAGGKMLLSWRVHLLPYLEQEKLYEQFHLDEPWDSEHNRTLIDKMPEVFRCPASKHAREQGLSTYRVVSGEGTVFPGREGIPLKEIKDGTSNTIMLVEVDDDHAGIWTKPEGLPFDPQNPARGLGGQFEGGFNAAFCDGSVQFLKLPADEENLRRLLLRADGQPVTR